MNNPTKEMLFRRYNLELSKFEGKIIAIGDLETEISHSIVNDISNTSADINALGLEDFRLINVSQLGISHYTIEDGKKIEKIKEGDCIRTGFYRNDENKFVAFEVNYLGNNKFHYKIKTNSQEYVERSSKPGGKHLRIFWD